MGKTVSKVLMIAAVVVAVVAITVATAGIATGVGLASLGSLSTIAGVSVGLSVSTLLTISSVLSIGASLLAPRPKPPGISSDTFDRLNGNMLLYAPRKALFGTTALAADMRDMETEKVDDKKTYLHRFYVCAAHYAEIDEIWLDDDCVWTLTQGELKYSSHTKVQVRNEGSAANAINISPRMGATRRYTGCAYIYLRFRIDEDTPWSSGPPSRITVRGKGMRTYDPRRDSTQPGGSGTQRWDNQATWQFGGTYPKQGENPALQMLTWLIGWKIAGRLSVGKGVPIDRINIPSFMAGANVCDEPVTLAAGGTEPRYVTHGIVSEADAPIPVVDRWKTSMNATLDDVDGQIRLQVLTNDLATYTASFTDDDIAGDGYNWRPFMNLSDQFNIIRGNYIDAGNTALYQPAEYPEVKIASLDGIERWESIDYGMVQSRSLARRLSKMRLQRALIPGQFQAVFQATAWRVQKGDPVQLSFSRLGWVNKLFRVAELEHRPDGLVPMILREESALNYQWDQSEGPEPVYPPVSSIDKEQDPWWLLASGAYTYGTMDGNLLADDLFGSLWTIPIGQRVFSMPPLPLEYPYASNRPWVLEIPLVPTGVTTAIATHINVLEIKAGRPYWLRIRVAKKTGTTASTGFLHVYAAWINAAGAQISYFGLVFNLTELPASGLYLEKVISEIAPVGTVGILVGINMSAHDGTGSIRVDAPYLSASQPGADVSTSITGPGTVTIRYDYTGTAIQATSDLAYWLVAGSGAITSGVTGNWNVLSGSVNGINSAAGNQPLSVVDGVGTLTITSMETDNAQINVRLISGVITRSFSTGLVKVRSDPPPVSPPSGGGGGTGSYPSSQTGGFNKILTPWATAQNILLDRLQVTMLAGKTTARVFVSLNCRWMPKAGQSNMGDWNIALKIQVNVGTTAAPTWQDLAFYSSNPDPYIDYVDTGDGGGGGPIPFAVEGFETIEDHAEVTPQSIILVSNYGTINATYDHIGRTPGYTYEYRALAWIDTGGTSGNSGGIEFVGEVSLMQP